MFSSNHPEKPQSAAAPLTSSASSEHSTAEMMQEGLQTIITLDDERRVIIRHDEGTYSKKIGDVMFSFPAVFHIFLFEGNFRGLKLALHATGIGLDSPGTLMFGLKDTTNDNAYLLKTFEKVQGEDFLIDLPVINNNSGFTIGIVKTPEGYNDVPWAMTNALTPIKKAGKLGVLGVSVDAKTTWLCNPKLSAVETPAPPLVTTLTTEIFNTERILAAMDYQTKDVDEVALMLANEETLRMELMCLSTEKRTELIRTLSEEQVLKHLHELRYYAFRSLGNKDDMMAALITGRSFDTMQKLINKLGFYEILSDLPIRNRIAFLESLPKVYLQSIIKTKKIFDELLSYFPYREDREKLKVLVDVQALPVEIIRQKPNMPRNYSDLSSDDSEIEKDVRRIRLT